MGRKPTPSHIKLVKGNPGRRPLNKREPKPKRVVPSPPEHLPPAAAVHWGRFAALFDRMGVLTEADAQALERLCCLYQETVELQQVLEKDGRFYTTTNSAGDKMIRPHPAAAQLADADRRFRGYLSDFGGTPSARVRVKTEDPIADEDPAAKHFG